MRFISNKIVTTPVSLEEAMKIAQEKKEAPSLDEVLAGLRNKQVKTASSEAVAEETPVQEEQVPEADKTAKVEVEIDKSLQKEANLDNLGDKAALPFGKKKEEKDEEEDEEEDAKEVEKGKCASAKKTLKMAKQLDFRNWEAEDVVKAWEQHGSIEACMKNVKDYTDNPGAYCGLLQVSSKVARDTIQKTAKKQTPAASQKKAKKSAWLKIAKLTGKERAFLEEYWRKIYGDEYVDALLSDK